MRMCTLESVSSARCALSWLSWTWTLLYSTIPGWYARKRQASSVETLLRRLSANLESACTVAFLGESLCARLRWMRGGPEKGRQATALLEQSPAPAHSSEAHGTSSCCEQRFELRDEALAYVIRWNRNKRRFAHACSFITSTLSLVYRLGLTRHPNKTPVPQSMALDSFAGATLHSVSRRRSNRQSSSGRAQEAL